MPSRKATTAGLAVVLLLISGVGATMATVGPSGQDSAASAHDHTTDRTDNATIHVSASADVSAPPDRALVRLAVVATADTAEEARNRAAEDADSMRAALREQGVADGQVRTAYYDLSAVHEDSENGTRIVGYRAVHAFEVEVDTDADELGNRTGTVIDTAVRNGANRVEGVQFTLAEETRRELRERALERAMANARDDADLLAATGDVRITGVRSVSTADVGFHPIDAGLRETADGGGGAATRLEPGPVTVSATVSVTYRAE